MTSNFLTSLVRLLSPNRRRSCVALLAVILALVVMPVHAQTFSSGSNGSDGAYAPSGTTGTVIVFNPAQFTGTQVAANIFNFTTITIPAGVTVRLSGNTLNGPVYWLASGDVDIEGTVDLSGGPGVAATTNPFARVPAVPGSGGYIGGVGGNTVQAALPGSGPGGGAPSLPVAGGGTFSGNQFLIPLVGGSGGGGGAYGNSSTNFCDGGGAGGGALLIASSTQIAVNGLINANGGLSGGENSHGDCNGAGGGGGGAVRLVSNTVTGGGSLTANGGLAASGGSSNGGPGVIRLEATTVSIALGNVSGTYAQSTPFPLLLPTAGPPSAQVISINGTPVTPNPNTFPDVTINTTSAVNVVIQTQNIPTTATITLTILDENGVADTVAQAPPLGNCNSSNVCTTTAQITFPFGASRGLTRVMWTQ